MKNPEQLAPEDKVVHFGPVYGRPVGQSMALCDRSFAPDGSSRTMTRSLKMISCDKCEATIQEMLNQNPSVRREDIT